MIGVFVLSPLEPVFSIPRAEAASVPSTLSYQGRLTDSSGNLLGGSGTNYYFKFSLWDNATVGSGNQVWPASAPTSFATQVKEGVFNVNIGDTANGYPDALTYSFNSPNLYLQVEVSSNNVSFETLSPRQSITSSAFAQVAGAVSGTGQSSLGTTTPASNAVVTVEATTTSAIPLVVRGTTGQTADLFSVRNSIGTSLFAVNSSGGLLASSSLQVTGATQLFGTVSILGGATTTFANGIELQGGCLKINGSCFTGSGGGSGITGIGPVGQVLTASTINFASSSDTNIGLTITGSGSTVTFAPTWSGVLSQSRGGTGITTYDAGDILYADNSNNLTKLPGGFSGQVLKIKANGLPGWGVDNANSGNDPLFSTTTDNLAITQSDPTQVLVIGAYATTSLGNILEVSGNAKFLGNVLVTGSSTLQNFTALKSTTTNATTSSFAITSLSGSLLKTNSDGTVVSAIAGVDYLSSAVLWSTTSNDYFLTQRSTTNL
ncbi:MAG TPA: hypothetical protein PLB51_01725, partial [Candidatus Paceibacterota bacterium]|nr:hypothetical protein [Candidatus Paceibacterota bacterium]